MEDGDQVDAHLEQVSFFPSVKVLTLLIMRSLAVIDSPYTRVSDRFSFICLRSPYITFFVLSQVVVCPLHNSTMPTRLLCVVLDLVM